MIQWLDNIYFSSFLICILQIIFFYARSLNIIHVNNLQITKAIISTNVISVLWLLSMTIGVNAILKDSWFPILGYMIGSSIGTFIPLNKKKKEKNNK